jgi:hypothetical protein
MATSSRSRQRADAKRASVFLRTPARVLTPFVRRPVESIACAVAAALLTGILLNALAFQNARHPSPLFGTPIAIAPQADAPKPVPRPLSINAAPLPIAPATQPVPIPTRPIGTPRDAETAPAKAADAIGDMLRAAPDAAASASSPSAIEAARILLVQKGLVKLGYAVRADGVMGSTTRQAIEKFERERGWPARGELTPRVLREISARSGLSLE